MKVRCPRETLLTAFQVANGVVPANSPKPILQSCLLEIPEDGDAALMATDLEVGLHYKIAGMEVQQGGKAVLGAAKVQAILRELSDDTVSLESTSGGVRLTGSGSKFDLPGEDPGQFPEMPSFGGAASFQIPAGKLVSMIRRTQFAAGDQNTRYALRSVLLEVEEGGTAKMVATDGHRLAVMPGLGQLTEGTDADAAGDDAKAVRSVLLPPKAVNLLQRILGDEEETVALALRSNEALARTNKVTVYTRLVEGRYPKYQDVFPRETKLTIPLEVAKFYGAVRQAKIVTSTESKSVRFAFAPGEVVLRSHGADAGESEVRLPLGYDGPELEISFNPELLIDALRILDGNEEITLHVGDPRRAAVFRTADGYQYVVMPLAK